MARLTPRYNLKKYRILYFPLLLPIALLIALFNKVSSKPFKIYNMMVNRVGHLAANQEIFCCHQDLGMLPNEFRVLVYRYHPANQFLMDMWKRVLPINQWFLPLFDVCNKLGGLGIVSQYIPRTINGADYKNITAKTSQHLSFTDEERIEARRQMRGLDIDPDKPFVPVLARDSEYLTHLKEPTDTDSYRNVDVSTFVPAMEYLADNYQVIRAGSVVSGPIQSDHPQILDYSLSGKLTELLDVYFSARCDFFFSSSTGLDSITKHCFRLPLLLANYIPPADVVTIKPGSLFIPKKYWHVSEERYLTLSEMLSSDICKMFNPRELSPLSIEVHDNTPEEIVEVAEEMVARQAGTWVENEEDLERQSQYKAIYEKYFPDHSYVGRIGTAFLRNNPEWIS